MKRRFAILLTAGMLLALTACNSSGWQEQPDAPSAQEPDDTIPAVQPSEAESETTVDTDGGNVLVVYFSASNHTETVAGYIADVLNADQFEIIPVDPYTSADLDWTDSDSRVSREHDDPSLRTMELTETAVEDWDSYDTVFIGYPIWWGIAAWPVDNFIVAHDFTDKIVIPFCTSASSGLGESGELLAELAGTGNWLEGRRFRSGASQTEVQEWVQSLELPTAN